MKNHDRLTTRAGFTLIELLISMAVSLVVLFATLQLFENSQRSYVAQEDVAEMQQNVRIAKLYMERDIRMAGAGIPDFSYGGNAVFPLEFENNVDGSGVRASTLPGIVAGTDLLMISYNNFSAEDCGADPGGVMDSCDDLPQLTLTGGMPQSSSEADVDGPLVDWDANCYCAGETYGTSGSSVIPAIISSPDGAISEVLFLTTIQPGPKKIQNHPASFEDVSYENKVANTFPVGSTINFFPADGLYTAIYYIRNVDGIPCLVRNAGNGGGQIIAEHVEDLQLSFGLDTTGDGNVDTIINGADLNGAATEDVRMVTLNLLGRSPHAQPNFNGQRPAMEDRAAGAADNFRRRQATVTIKVRNLGL